LELKQNDNSNRVKYGLASSPKLRKYVLDYMFYFLLLPYSLHQTSSKAGHSPASVMSTLPPLTDETGGLAAQAAAASIIAAAQAAASEVPACMSEAIYKRFKSDVNFDNGDEIEQLKIGILKFLAFNVFECEEFLFHFIVSTSDTRYSVVQVAEIHIKRIVGSVDLNEQSIVNRLVQIFMGDKSKVQQQQQQAAALDINRVEPANTRIRLKLFPYLLRSRCASCTMPQAIQLVFDCLFGSPLSTNQKIKNYAVQFVHAIALKYSIF
jgi:proteasome component ECM29